MCIISAEYLKNLPGYRRENINKIYARQKINLVYKNEISYKTNRNSPTHFVRLFLFLVSADIRLVLT